MNLDWLPNWTKQQWITALGIAASTVTFSLAQIANAIPPWLAPYVPYIMLAGALAATVGGALTKLLDASPWATWIGIGVAITATAVAYGQYLPDWVTQGATVLGALLAALGASIFGWGEDQGDGGDGPPQFISPRFQ